jgi:hypothetical protein
MVTRRTAESNGWCNFQNFAGALVIHGGFLCVSFLGSPGKTNLLALTPFACVVELRLIERARRAPRARSRLLVGSVSRVYSCVPRSVVTRVEDRTDALLRVRNLAGGGAL